VVPLPLEDDDGATFIHFGRLLRQAPHYGHIIAFASVASGTPGDSRSGHVSPHMAHRIY